MSIRNKKKFIENYLNNNNFTYSKIICNEYIDNIYNLYKNNIVIVDRELSDIEALYYEKYYRINKNYDQMKKYYLMGALCAREPFGSPY